MGRGADGRRRQRQHDVLRAARLPAKAEEDVRDHLIRHLRALGAVEGHQTLLPGDLQHDILPHLEAESAALRALLVSKESESGSKHGGSEENIYLYRYRGVTVTLDLARKRGCVTNYSLREGTSGSPSIAVTHAYTLLSARKRVCVCVWAKRLAGRRGGGEAGQISS